MGFSYFFAHNLFLEMATIIRTDHFSCIVSTANPLCRGSTMIDNGKEKYDKYFVRSISEMDFGFTKSYQWSGVSQARSNKYFSCQLSFTSENNNLYNEKWQRNIFLGSKDLLRLYGFIKKIYFFIFYSRQLINI